MAGRGRGRSRVPLSREPQAAKGHHEAGGPRAKAEQEECAGRKSRTLDDTKHLQMCLHSLSHSSCPQLYLLGPNPCLGPLRGLMLDSAPSCLISTRGVLG